MVFRSARICASVGRLAASSGWAELWNGEYETLFRTPSMLGAEAWLCQIAQAQACRHATSATTDTSERIALTEWGGGWENGVCPLDTVADAAATHNVADRG